MSDENPDARYPPYDDAQPAAPPDHTEAAPVSGVLDLPHRDSVESLRHGIERMKRRGEANPADYGPIMVWPETIEVLLDVYESVVAGNRG